MLSGIATSAKSENQKALKNQSGLFGCRTQSVTALRK
jgi:hypothetical protein